MDSAQTVESDNSCLRELVYFLEYAPSGEGEFVESPLKKAPYFMPGLDNFSEEALAVDSVSADVDVLEKLAACGGTLSEDDLKLLAQCNARLSHLVPLLAANKAAACSSPARKRPTKLEKDHQSATKFSL